VVILLAITVHASPVVLPGCGLDHGFDIFFFAAAYTAKLISRKVCMWERCSARMPSRVTGHIAP
jgi:hypothetical protein